MSIKKLWPYLVALIVFVVVAGVYMQPALHGYLIKSSDGIQGYCANREAANYAEQTGDHSFWIGSMFSGMPNYQVGGGEYEADVWLRPLKRVLNWGHRNSFAIVLIYCIGFFALLRSMKVDRWVSIVGALAIAFSSYFFIIIAANHHAKTSTLALMSMALAGFYLIFHGHRRWGVVLAMLGTMAGFYPHPQMAYYVCYIFAAFGLAELWLAIQSRQWRPFAINCVVALVALGIGIGTGMGSTYANLEYANETMRGGHSDLVKATDGDNKTSGLDLDYATAWSYGIGECWTFLVPDYMGGSSNYTLPKTSPLCQSMVSKGVPRRSAEQFCESVPTYWGTQPFTSGPVYMGALVCLLFVLGLFIVKGPYRWALLGVTVLSVLLSWGHNWMWFTRLFFDYVPMYNKFRAVSSILVIAEITMPLLGFLAVQRLIEAKREGEDLSRKVLMAGGVVVALLLVCLATTSGFVGAVDAQLPDWLQPLLVEQRERMFRGDLFRTLGFVLLGGAVLWFYAKSKKFSSTALLAVILGALVLVDMWPVDKRYMNDSYFMTASNNLDKQIRPTAWEQQILQLEGMDVKKPSVITDNHFRVYNLTANPFNDARTSCRLKSIGGYSAAKLRRYQDLIDQHLSKMHMPVINMLNTRYLIVPDRSNGNTPVVQRNPDAMGNAWFVDDVRQASTPNEECDALMQVDLRHVAVVGQDFADYVQPLAADSLATIRLTSYSPKAIDYESSSSQAGTVVFSEIYYPYGWQVTVDGQPSTLFRADYMLRALNLPAGQHRIHMEFLPESVARGNMLSMVFVLLMYAVLIGCIALGVREVIKK